MDQVDTNRKNIGWKSKLVLFFSSILIALFIIEAAIRIAGINDQFTRKVFSQNLLTVSDNPILIYELKPDGSSSIDGVDNRISRQGLRDREFDIPAPAGVTRIVAIGDSVTYGLGVRAEDTFSKQLELLLNEDETLSGQRFEVMNMGVNGYKTVQEVEHLKVNGLRFQPDIVLLSYNLNDPGDFSRELPYFNTWQDRKWTSDTMTFSQKLRARLTQFSELAFMIEYRTLRLKLGRIVEKEQANPADNQRRYDGYFHLYRNPQAMEALEKALDELQHMAAEHRFDVVFAVFPLLMQFDEYRWSDLHQQILQLAAKRGFHTIDLLPILQAHVASPEELQRRHDDFEHPNPLGHRIAAETLHAFMKQTVFSDLSD